MIKKEDTRFVDFGCAACDAFIPVPNGSPPEHCPNCGRYEVRAV